MTDTYWRTWIKKSLDRQFGCVFVECGHWCSFYWRACCLCRGAQHPCPICASKR